MTPAQVDETRRQSEACARQAQRVLAEGDLRTSLLLADAALALDRAAREAIEAWAEAPRRRPAA